MSNLDLLSNWSDITYRGDQIRFATTALNEIYVDYAKEDEIIMDKASGWLSYKRKDGQYIRPDYQRESYSSFLRDLMSCSKTKYRLNRSDWSKVPCFVAYNYNPSYDNGITDISSGNTVGLKNTPTFYCDQTACGGFFVKVNLDKDAMAYFGIIDDNFNSHSIVVNFTAYAYTTSGTRTTTGFVASCKPNQYTFVPFTIVSGIKYYNVIVSNIKLEASGIKSDTINESDKSIIGLFNNGSNLVISSIDFVAQVYMNPDTANNMSYRYRTMLHTILQPINQCKIESPGQAKDVVNKEYIYPLKLNNIVPIPAINDYMRIDQMNCIPKHVGTLNSAEMAYFDKPLSTEPSAKI